jgi:hypothetical protein
MPGQYLEIGLRFNRCGFYKWVDKINRSILEVQSINVPHSEVFWDNKQGWLLEENYTFSKNLATLRAVSGSRITY